METEKITINIGAIDLGQIDLLVEQGFYSNRSDFIRTAIRNQANIHASEISRIKEANSFGIDLVDELLNKVDIMTDVGLKDVFGDTSKFAGTGVFSISKKVLEEIKAKGNKLEVKMVGILIVSKEVTPELAAETFGKVNVFGIIKAPDAVKQILLNLK